MRREPEAVSVPDPPDDPEDEDETGGDLVCWAHLVCPECGAMTSGAHRPECALARDDTPTDATTQGR